MTEYDYSPAAYERYMDKQRGVSNWVSQTNQNFSRFGDPFRSIPSTRSDSPPPTSRSHSASRRTSSSARSSDISSARRSNTLPPQRHQEHTHRHHRKDSTTVKQTPSSSSVPRTTHSSRTRSHSIDSYAQHQPQEPRTHSRSRSHTRHHPSSHSTSQPPHPPSTHVHTTPTRAPPVRSTTAPAGTYTTPQAHTYNVPRRGEYLVVAPHGVPVDIISGSTPSPTKKRPPLFNVSLKRLLTSFGGARESSWERPAPSPVGPPKGNRLRSRRRGSY